MSTNEMIISEIQELMRKFEPNTDDHRVDLFFLCACHTKGDKELNVIGALQGKPGQLLATAMTTEAPVNMAVKEAVERNQALGFVDMLQQILSRFEDNEKEDGDKGKASAIEEEEANGE